MQVGDEVRKTMRARLVTLTTLMAAVLLAGGTVIPLLAEEDFRVDTLRYRNDGAYWAGVAVAYRRPNALVCKIRRDGNIRAGNTVDFKLGGENRSWTGLDSCSKDIPNGAEVWMIASVKTAPNYWIPRTCHKDETHFYASRDSGGTIKYRTRGGTQTANRCRINKRPSSNYLIDPPRKHAEHD